MSTRLASEAELNEILQVGTSAGGARAKAVIALNPLTGEVRSGQAKAPAGFDVVLIAAVIFAYVVRFSAIAHGAIDGAFGRVTPSMEFAARTLGETRRGALTRVHLPLIKGSVLTAALLIPPCKGRSCLGCEGELRGQNLVPDPPARITAQCIRT